MLTNETVLATRMYDGAIWIGHLEIPKIPIQNLENTHFSLRGFENFGAL